MIRDRVVPRRPWVIWGVFASVYLPSVLANVRSLTRPAGSAYVLPPGVTAASQLAAAAAFAALQIAAAGGALTLLLGPAWRFGSVGERRRLLGLCWSDGGRRIIGGTVGATFGYLAILAGAGFLAVLVLDGLGLTGRPTVGGSIPSMVLSCGDYLMSIGAGVGEEVLLLAIPFALATRAGWKPWVVLALLTGLRLSIHLYYGAGSVFVVLWVPAGYLLYRATRSIGPLIIGHIVYDLLATTVQRSPAFHIPALLLLAALSVLGSAVLAGSAARYLTTGRQAVRGGSSVVASELSGAAVDNRPAGN